MAMVVVGCAESPFRPSPTPAPPREVIVPFVNKAVDVFPVVGETLVVTGGGAAEISNSGVVRQEGTEDRFYVEHIGVTSITIYQDGQQMQIYVRSQPKPAHG